MQRKSFDWQKAFPTFGHKIEKFLNKKNDENIKKSSSQINRIGSFQEMLPIKTIVNGVIVLDDMTTFSVILKVGRVNFRSKDEDVQEKLLKKLDEVINTLTTAQFHYSKNRLNKEALLRSMELNNANLIGFEKEFSEIQKGHYISEIQKRDLSNTDRLIAISTKITRGKYKEKLEEATRDLNRIVLTVTKKLKNLGVNYVHLCNTYEALEVLFDNLANVMKTDFIKQFKSKDGIFITKDNLIDHKINEDFQIREKGNDLLAIGEWSFKDSLSIPLKFEEDYIRIGEYYQGIGCISFFPNTISDLTFKDILEQSKYNFKLSVHIEKTNKKDIIVSTQNRLNMINRKLTHTTKNRETLENERDKLQIALRQLNGDTNNFLVKVYYSVIENSYEKMKDGMNFIQKLLDSKVIEVYIPVFEMKEAFLSLLPIGYDFFDKKLHTETRIGEYFLTEAVSCINIFDGTEIFDTTRLAIRYGYDTNSNNFVVVDRERATSNPAGLILGVPGTGKSTAAKHEITELLLVSDKKDHIFTFDYIGEYSIIAEKFNYPDVVFSKNSNTYINFYDLNPYSNLPLIEKAEKNQEFFELLLNRELTNLEKYALDNAFYEAYREKGITEENQKELFIDEIDVTSKTILGSNNIRKKLKEMPKLQDIQKYLNNQGVDGKRLAKEINMYTEGTYNFLNHETTVNIYSKYVNFNFSKLPEKLKKIVFYICMEHIKSISIYNYNSNNKRKVWIYYDELHRYTDDPIMGKYIAKLTKEGRKEGLYPTGITQNVQDLLSTKYGELVIVNSQYILLLGTDKASIEKIATLKALSESDKEAFLEDITNAGDGLLLIKGDRIPIHISASDWELKHFDTKAY